uniref:Triacylglycerol lipase n=1 Tax=Gopherus evgoodei TaxID=1825980 RepID=A0A8C4YP84_9SAUR
MLGIWILALFLLGTARGEEVCFERLGCFTDNKPWAGTTERPVAKLPWSPETINTRFLLYTKKNPNDFQEITAINPASIGYSNFDLSKITRFITHGFLGQGEETWLSDMLEDVNCISVDWSGGSRCLYSQAANNIRVVGAEVAYFVNVLKEQYGYSPSKVHFIGHSLGAHAAGEAGRRSPGFGRITGLDPAQPYFQDTPVGVRLDKTDAAFVDIIHTDTAPTIPNLGFGMSQAIGHLDFYPNGGEQMPGCTNNRTVDFVACNHLRSFKYYFESIISPNGFLGYICDSYDIFQTENCFPCPKGGCPQMGHYADKFKDRVTSGIQKLYLNTGEDSNFARWRYKVSVAIAGKSKVSGYVNIALYGAGGNTRQYEIVQGTLKPGETYAKFIDVEINVGRITKVKFLWDNHVVNPTLPTLGAAAVTVQAGEDGNVAYKSTSGFCIQQINMLRDTVPKNVPSAILFIHVLANTEQSSFL